MRLCSLALLFLLVSIYCHGQQQPGQNNQYNNNQYQNNPNERRDFYMMKFQKFRKMRNTGAFFTVGGTVLIVYGISTLVDAAKSSPSNANNTKASQGAYMWLGGLACLGAGIPLLCVGQHNYKKYGKKVEQSFTVKLNVTPQSAGVGLRYKF